MNFNPKFDNVLVRLGAFRKSTKAGIVLPKEVELKDFPIQYAEVVSIGPGGPLENGERRPMDVKPGDVIAMHAKCPKIRVPTTAEYDSRDPSRLVLVMVSHIVAGVDCTDEERKALLDPNSSDEESDEGDAGDETDYRHAAELAGLKI